MVSHIQDHIGSLNWGYRTALQDKGIKYLNALGTFIDDHTVKVREGCGSGEEQVGVCGLVIRCISW